MLLIVHASRYDNSCFQALTLPAFESLRHGIFLKGQLAFREGSMAILL